MNGNGDKPVIHDLDILRPPPEYVRLGGHDIDISFIPSGIAIDVTNLEIELREMMESKEKIQEDDEAASKTFDMLAELCSRITRFQHEEMTKEWILKNTDIVQLNQLMLLIIQGVRKSLNLSEDEETKKQQTTKASP